MTLHRTAVLAAMLVLVGCDPESEPASDQREVQTVAGVDAAAATGAARGPGFPVCPHTGDAPREQEMRPGANNPPLTVRGHQLRVPGNAITVPTTFRMEVPADSVIRVYVTAVGQEDFTFAAPAELTIMTRDCPAEAADRPLYMVEVDEQLTIIDSIGGQHDPGQRRVTAEISGLSQFMLAYP